MPKFKFNVVLNPDEAITARVSDSTAGVTASFLGKNDSGKFVKLTADSQYGLCAVGNEIEGVLQVADDLPPQDGFALGAVNNSWRLRVPVTFDGVQATPGTGTIALGDYVVAGTVTPRGTVLPGPVKVCKATAAATSLVFKWRVVSMDGTGAVGQTGMIERVA